MGIAASFQSAARQIVAAFGDVALACDYLAVPGDPEYYPESGLHVWHDVPEPLTAVPIIFDEYSQFERQNNAILPEDEKAIVAASDLAATDPKVGHLLRKPDESVWMVKDVTTDPAKAHWELQIRRWQSQTGWPV